MPNYSIDAIKIARAIQKNKLSILDGKEFKMRDKIKKRKRMKKKKTKRKYTLNQIGNLVFEMSSDLKKINTRLDYIVKANNLKDSK